jgi:hypothetical protein
MLIYLADLAHTASVSDRSLTIPLGIGYIKAYAEQALGDGVTIRLFKHPEKLLAAVAEQAPDVVGLANYGWNDHLNLTIGSRLRQLLPDALFVAGGPNIDPDPALRLAFLQRHAYLDYLVIDSGEEPFAELVQWWQGARDPDQRPQNLIWREGDSLGSSGERPLQKVVENIVSPYLSGALDEFLAAGMVPLLETNRGCPFRCTFCAWGMAAKDLVRRLDFDVALEEIAYVGARSDALNWIVCDANFGLLKRDVDIAKALRAVRDQKGLPRKCHIWLAKNATVRNLEIAAILGDMTVPVMAVQSMSDEVLKNIKRDNIQHDTYIEYQKKFHAIGSTTYSDMIVPLPGETLDSHLAGLAQMFAFDVDIIQNHNMRLLAGAETNSTETRQTFGFRTRYRLIHGDAGLYKAPDGSELASFECEESLRATSTMSEEEVFGLRRLHFLVDFCWNNGVYKPLLRVLRAYGANVVEILQSLIRQGQADSGPLGAFWAAFEEASQQEWYDSEEELRAAFADPVQFQRLINQDFEKLNIQFSVIALRDCKAAFDQALRQAAEDFAAVPAAVLDQICARTFVTYPPLDFVDGEQRVEVAANLGEISEDTAATFVPAAKMVTLTYRNSDRREQVRQTVLTAKEQGQTLSKVLNVQSMSLRDLALVAEG